MKQLIGCYVYVESPYFMWRAYVVLYFISFDIILNLYILSILLAIFLDAFLVFQNIKEDTIEVIRDDDKAVAMLGIPKSRYVLLKHRTLEEVLYEEFLQDNHLNTIEELFKLGVITEKNHNVVKSKLERQKRKKRLSRCISSTGREKSAIQTTPLVVRTSTMLSSDSRRK